MDTPTGPASSRQHAGSQAFRGRRRGRPPFFAGLASALALALALIAPSADVLARNGATEVDVELVIAVDVSYSMDLTEQVLQREGYMKAFVSPEVLKAVRQGAVGKIAVTYFEWASNTYQRVIVPWHVIDGPESAEAFVAKIAAVPPRREARTSISGAIEFGRGLFDNNGFDSVRRVIDVSGDGPNNNGIPVEAARDAALSSGIVINGLPVMIYSTRRSAFDVEDLDLYYKSCVIGGPGSFVIAIRERDQFVEATRNKIVREIATAPLPSDDRIAPTIIPAGDDRPIDCLMGERQWMERYRN